MRLPSAVSNFDNTTITPATICYFPNVPYGTPDGGMAVDQGQVYMSFTADPSSEEASIIVNVYLPWEDGMSDLFPLIGSFSGLGFTYGSPGTTESYSVLTTLPDPMAFNVTVPPINPNSDEALRPLDFFFTYGDQTSFLPSVPNDGTVTVGYFEIASVPPGAWWNVMDP